MALSQASFCYVSSDLPTTSENEREELLERAHRLKAFKDGEFEPSEGGRLVKAITDQFLVMASGVVSQATGKATLGKPEKRLLAWLVADAAGALQPLEKKLADVVGLRLERQAEHVRAAIQETLNSAAEQRADAKAALEADPELAESLPSWEADLAKWEQQELQKHYDEVYVGFWELGELMPEAPVAVESECSLCGNVLSAPCHVPEPRKDDVSHLRDFEKWEWPDHEADVIGGPPIPPFLAERLGEQGCLRLTAECSGRRWTGNEMINIAIPRLVMRLTEQIAEEQRCHEEDLRRAEECARGEAFLCAPLVSELRDEVSRLKEQLAEARGREAALHDIIRQYLPSSVVH